jgi:hypothetical protein
MDSVRFRVVYINKDGKRRTTEVSATGKIQAASILLNTLAQKVLKVTPIRQ